MHASWSRITSVRPRPVAVRCVSVGLFTLAVSCLALTAAPTIYSIDISAAAETPKRGHLDLGGTRADGRSFEVTSHFIEKDGRPVVPVIGEFHFSRFPPERWEDALRKIKAGGVDVVATYVFWNMHERREGEFDWSGQLDLRRFVQLVDAVGLHLILRVGPFAHGEIRNGGLPDWTYGKPFEIRSNDAGYLRCVERLYAAIGSQVTGLLFKDGGPIIGIQLENEYQHSAAPWEIRHGGAPITRTIAARDRDVTHDGVSISDAVNENRGYGRDHMMNLKRIAKASGLDVPLHTATGWGNAAIVPGGSVPVTAAYAYPFWTPRAAPSPFYLFKDIRAHPDYAPVSFDTTLYPSMPAEMGAGIAPTYARRPYFPEESIAPMVVRMLGSGSNGIGYYMYHGGATPAFDGVPYNEDASGLPKVNYDYQAPIGQYGRAKDHYFSLRPLHLFLKSYGERLAELPSILPATNAGIIATDTDTLRFAARAAGGSGFLFLVNFQDHAVLKDLTGLQLAIDDGRRRILVPSSGTMTLRKGAAAILPINLDLDGTPLRSATVQPLAVLRRSERTHFVFFSIDGLEPELVFDRVTIEDPEGCAVSPLDSGSVVRGQPGRCFSFTADGKRVTVVTAALARQAVPLDGGRLLFAKAMVTVDGGEVTLRSAGETRVDVFAYPRGEEAAPALSGATLSPIPAPLAAMVGYRLEFPKVEFAAEWVAVAPDRYVARFGAIPEDLGEVYMRINYVGDTAMAFIDGRLVDDHFYSGRPWEIALGWFKARLPSREIVFVFQPIRPDASYLGDLPEEARPAFRPDERSRLEVRGLEFIPEYRAALSLPGASAEGGS